MLIKDRIASGLGSILEWYDFTLYSFFAPVIAELYFSSQSSENNLLKALSIFAVGFFARPFGALLFGSISDKFGRTVSLKLTPILITIPTALFAILPTYKQIGILAPITLIFLRIFQGVCIGGEHVNNIVYLCETAKPRYVYFFGSIGSCIGSTGILLASSVAATMYMVLSNYALITWGWRLAFIMSVPIGVAIFLLRKNLQETNIYAEMIKNNQASKKPIRYSFIYQWKKYCIAVGLTLLPATAFYYVFIFLPTLLNTLHPLNSSKILGNNSFSLLVRLFFIPIMGLIADKIGGLKIARLSAILFLLFSYPLLNGVLYNIYSIQFFTFIFALFTTLNAATTPGLLMELIQPKTRCTIFSFSFNLCFGAFGGLVPVISFLLIKKFDSNIASVYCLMIAALITLITTFLPKKGFYYD